VVSLTVAVTILVRRPRRSLYLYFSAFSFVVFCWHAASLVSRFSETLTRLQMIAAVLVPATAVPFFKELLASDHALWRRLVPVSLVTSTVFLVLAVSPLGRFWPVQLAAVVYVVVIQGASALAMREQLRASRSEDERRRLAFLLYSGVIAFVLAAGELVPRWDALAALGHIAVTFYIYFLYQSILSRRLIDMVELFGKAAVLTVLTLVLSGVYVLLIGWVGAEQPGLWFFNTLVASFVILILYDQIRPWVEDAAAKFLFARRYELRLVVRTLLRRLRTTIDVDAMCREVLVTLTQPGLAENVAVYLPEEGDLVYRLAAHRGPVPPRELSVARQGVLVQELRRERRPVLWEHLQHRLLDPRETMHDHDPALQREHARIGEAMEAMEALRASVLLPMVGDDHLVGILSVGSGQDKQGYSTEEIAVLLSVAEACAIVIVNGQEYDKNRRRDRLAAVGEMATGMAHEVRNPLGAIKGAAQCLDPGHLSREAAEYVQVILEEVDRLNGVVEHFLEYARPYEGNPTAVDVNQVIANTLQLLRRDWPEALPLRQDLALELPAVFIDPERLRQVLINLLQNALHACAGVADAHVAVTSACMHRAGATPEDPVHRDVVISVVDRGRGIAPADLERVFVPFFTTRQRGTGLGLPICQRIVATAGGRIDVQSQPSGGATFAVWLPARDAA
jgi:signal transduction histidine kinase